MPAAALARAQEPGSRIEVRVDLRIELATIVARLAGFREFNMASSASPYAEDVEKHFGRFRQHDAVKLLAELRAQRGVSNDAIPSLAVHLGPLPGLAERVPFDPLPERLDTRWGIAGARGFVTKLRDFATASRAEEFFARHRELYAETERRLGERLSRSRAIPWFDAFFGVKAGAKYVAIPGLLCGGGSYGVGVRFPDQDPEEITPVFGCWAFDDRGVPLFDDRYLPLFVHEICHSYTNPFVDRFESELEPAGSRLYSSCAEKMKSQNYGSWRVVLYESLVRASTVRCRLATEGRQAAEEQAREEAAKGFTWVPDLARLFGDYESGRDKYPNFDAFMPRVVKFFNEEAARVAEGEGQTPRVVSMEPRPGSIDVDPRLAAMMIRFDRAMKDQSWSLAGDPADMPAVTGKLSYDAARKVLTVPIRLDPGRSYRFSLNSKRFTGFRSDEGVPLPPFEVKFSTRK